MTAYTLQRIILVTALTVLCSHANPAVNRNTENDKSMFSGKEYRMISKDGLKPQYDKSRSSEQEVSDKLVCSTSILPEQKQ